MLEKTLFHYLCMHHSKAIDGMVLSRLLNQYASLATIRRLPEQSLREFGLNARQLGMLMATLDDPAAEKLAEEDLSWASKPHNSLVCYESEYYPPLLRQTVSAPPLLYVVGQQALLTEASFAIVGSRKASNYGSRNAYWMAHELSKAGLQICSGMARGIDSKAHQGALDAGGKTVAVMATGADKIYPNRNRVLADKIIENGALITEFPLGTLPFAYNFPRRNRIISGISLGTLVVEASARSGSLITSRFALEQNRDVFAFPGSIASQLSSGCHQLIKQGAKLVEEPLDILQELGIEPPPAVNTSASEKPLADPLDNAEATEMALNSHILRAMGHEGCLMQTLLESTGLEMQQLNTQLLQLEMEGRIVNEGGRYFRTN